MKWAAKWTGIAALVSLPLGMVIGADPGKWGGAIVGCAIPLFWPVDVSRLLDENTQIAENAVNEKVSG